jgi:hypothetical protein
MRRFAVVAAFLMLGESLLLVDASAQSAPMTRYPWDRRAELCTPPRVPSGDQCNPDDWPSWSATTQRIELLYTMEQFALLERAMREVLAGERFYPGGDTPASAAYWAFRRLMPAPGAAEDNQRKIDAWKNAVPASDFTAFAQARFIYASAWSIRGSGGGSSVSKESSDLFGIRLRAAEDILLKAPEALKGTPLWHNLLLAIVLDSPQSVSNVDTVFRNAVKRWPRYFDIYELSLTRMVPRWGGSWERVESFIDGWSRQLSGTEGESVYARLYVSLRSQGVTPDQTRADWPRMRASFEDLTTRYPSPDYRNLYASYSCAARDKAAFTAALAKLSPLPPEPRNWLPGHSYEACMRWAGI